MHDQLLDAVERGDVEGARRLLVGGSDPHSDSWGFSLIEQAIDNRDIAMVRLLIDFGAALDHIEGDGRHRLHTAAGSSNNPQLVRLLLALGLDPHVEDRHGWTPLHHAAAQGYDRVGAALLAAGADPQARTRAGQTPSELAAINGHVWRPPKSG